jgi:hypothetical protein
MKHNCVTLRDWRRTLFRELRARRSSTLAMAHSFK